MVKMSISTFLRIYKFWDPWIWKNEENYLLRYNAVYSVESKPTFRRNVSPLAFTLVYCSAYPTMKEAICSSETSVHFERTTRRYIPEDSTLHNHRREDLKSYIKMGSSILCICMYVRMHACMNVRLASPWTVRGILLVFGIHAFVRPSRFPDKYEHSICKKRGPFRRASKYKMATSSKEL
jgi:hypothetical protein